MHRLHGFDLGLACVLLVSSSCSTPSTSPETAWTQVAGSDTPAPATAIPAATPDPGGSWLDERPADRLDAGGNDWLDDREDPLGDLAPRRGASRAGDVDGETEPTGDPAPARVGPLAPQAQEPAETETETAAGKPFSDEQWHFTVAPYMWLPVIKTWSQGVSSTVHQGDLLDDLDIAYMGFLSARYQRWGVSLDSVFFRVSDSFDPKPRLYTKVKVKESLYQLQGFYRLGEENSFVDVTAGARWVSLSTAFDLYSLTISRTRNSWFEPVVGLRGAHHFADRWVIGARADIGGFGIGEASDISYQGIASLDYEISKTVSVGAGYRYFFVDQPSQIGFKQRNAGPVAGMRIRF